MTNNTPKYRKAFITEPGYNFSALKGLVQENIFLTTKAEETLQDVQEAIQSNLKDFDPELDIIVPVGRTLLSFVVALEVAHHDKVRVAVYRGHGYQVVNMHQPATLFGIPNRF